MNITIDATAIADFNREFKARVLRSSKSFPEVVNRSCYNIAVRALKATQLGDRQKIEALGVSAYKVFSVKKNTDGTTTHRRLSKPVKVFSYGGQARDIWVGSYRKNHGMALPPELGARATAAAQLTAHVSGVKPGLRGVTRRASATTTRGLKKNLRVSQGAAEKKIKGLINGRLKAVGFLKSGWIPAIRAFAAATNQPPDATQGVKLTNRQNGSATVAKEGWNPTGMVAHNARFGGRRSAGAYQNLANALNTAIRGEANEMAKFAATKLANELM